MRLAALCAFVVSVQGWRGYSARGVKKDKDKGVDNGLVVGREGTTTFVSAYRHTTLSLKTGMLEPRAADPRMPLGGQYLTVTHSSFSLIDGDRSESAGVYGHHPDGRGRVSVPTFPMNHITYPVFQTGGCYGGPEDRSRRPVDESQVCDLSFVASICNAANPTTPTCERNRHEFSMTQVLEMKTFSSDGRMEFLSFSGRNTSCATAVTGRVTRDASNPALSEAIPATGWWDGGSVTDFSGTCEEYQTSGGRLVSHVKVSQFFLSTQQSFTARWFRFALRVDTSRGFRKVRHFPVGSVDGEDGWPATPASPIPSYEISSMSFCNDDPDEDECIHMRFPSWFNRGDFVSGDIETVPGTSVEHLHVYAQSIDGATGEIIFDVRIETQQYVTFPIVTVFSAAPQLDFSLLWLLLSGLLLFC